MGEIFRLTLAECNIPLLTFESVGNEDSAELFKILAMYLH